MTHLCSFIILSCSILSLSSATTLDCSYEYWTFDVIGSVYHCEIQSNPNITSPESAIIDGASGPHHGPKTDDDVAGFYVKNNQIKLNFFPLGLEKVFKNIKLIYIHHNGIKELHQSDLKELIKLEYLSLTDGHIQVIEEGLFDYNQELLYISFEDNRISQIYPNVFDNLTKLTSLKLDGNRCKVSNAGNSTEVREVVAEIKICCLIKEDSTATDLESDDDLIRDGITGMTDWGLKLVPKIYIVIFATFLHCIW
ncbi:chondroadherin-like [Chironomus tepperi]|uniref:chondroadherin-like n=1 Tax=Chironomus tepperi TaxID=113505 RepID=UPI00391FC74E